MPPRKRSSSVLDGEHRDPPEEAETVTDADDALAAAEEAEAEAAEAEAVAAAARARARAIRLRREAAAAKSKTTVAAESKTTIVEPESTETESDGPPVIESALDAPAAAADDSVEEADAAEEPTPKKAPKLKKPKSTRGSQGTGLVVLTIASAAVVIVVSAALLALTTAMFVHNRNVEHQRELSAEFSAAARQGVVTLMSLNFNNAKEDVQRIIDNTTGDFRKDFEGQAEDFVKVAQESKVVTEANVNAVAVQRFDDNTATVLVAVVTNVSNAASKEQAPRSWRLSVDVAREDGQIKLAKVEFVP